MTAFRRSMTYGYENIALPGFLKRYGPFLKKVRTFLKRGTDLFKKR
jgi:hypothetical protein